MNEKEKNNSIDSQMTWEQKAIWLHQNKHPHSSAYNTILAINIHEPIKINLLNQSINLLINRHIILKSNYPLVDGQPKLIIQEDRKIEVNLIDTTDEDDYLLSRRVLQDSKLPFNLENEPLIKVFLYKKKKNEFILMLNIHHILVDLWSYRPIIRDLFSIYSSIISGQKISLKKIRSTYSDFCNKENNFIESDIGKKQFYYWEKKLENPPKNSRFTVDYTKKYFENGDDSNKLKKKSFKILIEKKHLNRFQNILKKNRASYLGGLLSLMAIILYMNTQQTDIIFGSPFSRRTSTRYMDTVGCLMNPIALRLILSSEETFISLLIKSEKTILEAIENQDYPFPKLVSELNIPREENVSPFFQIGIDFQQPTLFGEFGNLIRNGDSHEKFIFEGMSLSSFPIPQQEDQLDMMFVFSEEKEGLYFNLKFNEKIYKISTIKNIIKQFSHLMKTISSNENVPFDKINLISTRDRKKIIQYWNETKADYPRDKTIYQLFEEQVQRTPENIAVVYENTQLTYQALNEKSNQLARLIRDKYKKQKNKALSPDSLIGLCVERSLEMIIGILGILKSGAAYVPLDPDYPQNRLEYMIEDSHEALIITQKSIINKDSFLSKLHPNELLIIDNDSVKSTLEKQDTDNLESVSRPDNLVYVIYTSGSTGKPKGVMIEHRSLVNYMEWMINEFNFNSSDIFFQKTEYNFDASVWELLLPLIIGAKGIMTVGGKYADPRYLVQKILDEKITIAQFVPVLFDLIMAEYADQLCHSNLSKVFCGGELLNLTDNIKKLKSGKIELNNLYGPTEATIDAAFYRVNYKSPKMASAPIGKALNNTQLYLLDSHLNVCPIGIPGELHIGGVCLARGYLNKDELTKERFIQNPFFKELGLPESDRIYKTGDLARWLPDGNIEYLGRTDFQVKIRGFRIELGEIESKLSGYPGVKQTVTLAKEQLDQSGLPTGNKYLVGYYVANESLDHSAMLTYLSEYLPNYMVPSVLVWLDKLPLTANGKLDRKALPNPEFIMADHYVAPRNELEQQVCAIYAEVLRLPEEKVGIFDDFFRLGGDSILSIQVSSRLRKSNINCAIKDIFMYRTSAQLATFLAKNATKLIEVKTEQGLLDGTFDLLPIQHWFFEQVMSGRFKHYGHWNQSFLIRVPELDKNKLEHCLVKLVEHHDILRIRFKKEKNRWLQSYQQDISFAKLKVLNIKNQRDDEVNQVFTLWQSEFDVINGPLFQIGYVSGYKDGSARIYCAFHNLIIDSVSWRILISDIHSLYEGNTLGNKGSSYRQWVEVVKAYPLNHITEESYWKAILNALPHYSVDELFSPSEGNIQLSKMVTQQLLQKANLAYNTEINDLLLTSLAYTLKDWQGSVIHGITLEGHGREHMDASIDHNNTVGWFTTLYPVKLELQETIRESIKYIKESLRLIPNKGLGYGSFSVLGKDAISFNQLPSISFNYLGQFDSQDENWQIALENSGLSMHPDNESSQLININGFVSAGRLHFSIVTRLGEHMTQLMTIQLEKHLKNIIAHCLTTIENSEQESTPSDFYDFIPYEIINTDINENPIFIFPPGQGGAESYYNNLLLNLKNKNLVLFNNFFNYVQSNQLLKNKLTFEELAKYCILHLNKIQPKGPYILLGWSFGGVLAFEIARQLKQNGQAVRKLILLDAYFKYKEALHYVSEKIKFPMEFYKDINYQYDPIISDRLFDDTEIILLKANNMVSSHKLKDIIPNASQEVINCCLQLHQYYIGTDANNIQNYVNHFNLYKLGCDHYNIVENIDMEIYLKDCMVKP